jgi:hypothetical protein
MDRRILAPGLALFVIVGAILWIPWATKQRTVTASTAVPPPLFGITPAPLRPGQTACMKQVTLDPSSQVGQIGVTTGGKPGPALAITASAPGYRATSQVPAGYTDSAAVHFSLTPPRKPVIGQLCIRNAGGRATSLNATAEFRTMGRATLEMNGVPQPYDAQLAFLSTKEQSYAGRIGATFKHAAEFTPGFLGRPVLILLGLLALIGIPLGSIAALAIAARSDEQAGEPEPGEPEPGA